MAHGSTRLIEDFRGDFDRVATLIEASWASNATTPFLYAADLLSSWFQYPGADFLLAPTIYDGDVPVAFVAGFPRRARLGGRDYTILLVALLTAAAEHRNKGYGIVIWSELVRRARAAGFDGMVNYCVEGEAMNRMIVGACSRLGVPVERVYSVEYLSRLLLPSRSTASDGPSADHVDAFLDAAAPVAETAALARLWSRAEATWQCTRAGAVVARAAADGLDGILSGYVIEVANPQRTKCLVVDDVLWGGLAESERPAVVRRLVGQAAAAGAQIAVVAKQGYADTGAFTGEGFRPSGRVVHTYLTLWSGRGTPKSVPSCYLDIF